MRSANSSLYKSYPKHIYNHTKMNIFETSLICFYYLSKSVAQYHRLN